MFKCVSLKNLKSIYYFLLNIIVYLFNRCLTTTMQSTLFTVADAKEGWTPLYECPLV